MTKKITFIVRPAYIALIIISFVMILQSAFSI